MDGNTVAITHDEGVDSDLVKGLGVVLSQVRRFLQKAEELGLAISDINFVRLGMFDFAPSEDNLSKWELDAAAQREPLLAPFERDLVSLHLPADGQADEGHLYEAVWRTTVSMERFRRLLNLAWKLHEEYGLGGHRALDQRH